jgi:hypothetical protein
MSDLDERLRAAAKRRLRLKQNFLFLNLKKENGRAQNFFQFKEKQKCSARLRANARAAGFARTARAKILRRLRRSNN